MSHQPYESYLFSTEPLDAEQQQGLDTHLAECQHCHNLAGALTTIDNLFSNSPSPSPASGFTQRWHARLSVYRQERQIRNLWLITLVLFALAGLLMFLLAVFNLIQINWVYEFSKLIASFSLAAARVRQFSSILQSLNWALPFILPMMGIIGFGIVCVFSALTFTWFSSLIRLYSPIYQKEK